MKYVGTSIPDSLSVKSIFTVFHPDLSRTPITKGPGEAHNFPEIIYIDNGQHTLTVDGIDYELRTGQALIYAPNSHHKSKEPSNSKASIISFEADSEILPTLYNRVLTLTDSQIQMFSDIIEEGINCFVTRGPGAEVGGMILKDGVGKYELQKIKKQLELLLIDIHKNLTETNDKKQIKSEEFEKAAEFLKSKIHESLTRDEIAAGCSMSVSKLKILFRENCETGPINYFIDLKLKEAKRLIKESSLNFTEIAELLGFNSLHYFSRLFKERVGMTPSEYARSVSN